MTNHDPTPRKVPEWWAKTWPLVLVLIVTTIAWSQLSHLALHARVQGDPAQIAKGPNTADYGTAKTWATDLLGIAATFAGFLGIAAAAKKTLALTPSQRAQSTEGGIIGILAGATLLNIGGWPVPIALVAMATGAATDRVVRALREK